MSGLLSRERLFRLERERERERERLREKTTTTSGKVKGCTRSCVHTLGFFSLPFFFLSLAIRNMNNKQYYATEVAVAHRWNGKEKERERERAYNVPA